MRRILLAAVVVVLALASWRVALADDPDGDLQLARDKVAQLDALAAEVDALLAGEIAKPPVVSTVTEPTTQTTTVTVTANPSPSPSTTPPSAGCEGVNVTAPASIQAAVNANPTGTIFCLSGSFSISAEIVPKNDQSFVGPASITTSNGTDQGFAMQSPAISGVTIEGLELFGFDLRAVEVGDETVVRDNHVHHNLRNGIGGGNSDGVLIEGNEIAFNGSAAHLGSGAAGVKLAGTGQEAGIGATFRDNFVHHNVGNGLWCDVDCHGDTFVGNTMTFNTRAGLHYEISSGPTLIAGNTANDNNTEGNNPSAGIYLNSSCPASAPGGCLIEDNTALRNAFHDINIRDDSRAFGPPFEIIIRNNDVTAASEVDGCSFAGVTCSGNA